MNTLEYDHIYHLHLYPIHQDVLTPTSSLVYNFTSSVSGEHLCMSVGPFTETLKYYQYSLQHNLSIQIIPQ